MKPLACIIGLFLTLPATKLQGGEAPLEAVKRKLTELKGDGAAVKPIDPKDTAAVPGFAFVGVYFPQFPVARAAPEPLKQQNLFAVDAAGKVTHLPDVVALEKMFKDKVGPIKDEFKVANTFAHLAEVFYQDGFFKFELDKKSVKKTIKTIGKDDLPVFVGQVNVVPEAGNKGYFRFEMVLDAKDKIVAITQDNKVVAGIRPRCQATRLLDPDPVIREICERDLLVMGRLAESYLMEQRALAGPKLQREIDRVWRRILDEGR